MGHGIVGLVTPGWWFMEKKYEPHVHKPSYVDQMLKEGQDPKPLLLEECKPHCFYWKDKLTRCESALEQIIRINPTKTCLYPMRDYVTCVEACTQPIIHEQLKGVHH